MDSGREDGMGSLQRRQQTGDRNNLHSHHWCNWGAAAHACDVGSGRANPAGGDRLPWWHRSGLRRLQGHYCGCPSGHYQYRSNFQLQGIVGGFVATDGIDVATVDTKRAGGDAVRLLSSKVAGIRLECINLAAVRLESFNVAVGP